MNNLDAAKELYKRYNGKRRLIVNALMFDYGMSSAGAATYYNAVHQRAVAAARGKVWLRAYLSSPYFLGMIGLLIAAIGLLGLLVR